MKQIARFDMTCHLAAFILTSQCGTPVHNAYGLPQAFANYCRYIAKNN